MSGHESDIRLFELVFCYIHDIGRSVDLGRLEREVNWSTLSPKRFGSLSLVRRDTPISLSLPRPLCVNLENAYVEGVGTLSATAKIYEDGAITIILRTKGQLSIDALGPLSRDTVVSTEGGKLSVEAYGTQLFYRVLNLVSFAIVDPVPREKGEIESYTSYCLLDCPEGASAFVGAHRGKIAALLIGEEDPTHIHESQISAALARPFSYRTNDMAIFDMDRCFIIDPLADYEDILLITEHANFRLLELRVLDRLLDSRLDEAEKDLTVYGIRGYGSRKPRARLKGRAPQRKFARIQALRFEALFILENLENSAKIIGDYYLGQIYDRLCSIFNTDGWSRSVERRLDVLSSVYEMVKTDSTERKFLILETVFIVVCVVLPLIQIWQVLAFR